MQLLQFKCCQLFLGHTANKDSFKRHLFLFAGGSDTNGLPPLFPRQQSNPGNGHQATPKLIEEVEQGGGGSGRNGHGSGKHQKKGKNGGKNGGQKRSSSGHSASSKNRRKQRDTVNGQSLEESGRGLDESGRSLVEVVSELRIGDRSDGGQHLEKEGTETGGAGSLVDGEGESGRSLGESGEGRRVIPENRVTVKEEGGRDVVVVRVKLPEVTSAEQISLDGSEVRRDRHVKYYGESFGGMRSSRAPKHSVKTRRHPPTGQQGLQGLNSTHNGGKKSLISEVSSFQGCP